MKIYRLKVKIQGTKRSIRLDEDEIFNTYIPTWIPNPDQNLYTIDDYLDNIINAAPLRTGDWIKKLSLESTDVQDKILLKSIENFEIYGEDEDEEVKWIFEFDVIHKFITSIIKDESICDADLYELATRISCGKDIFGWSNVDPGDLTPEIVSELVVMGYGDSDNF